jgi:uncharacterized protein YqgV (UPF0045/DUF77 family)
MNKKEMLQRINVPSTIPKNPLDNLESCITIFRVVPFRIDELSFTSLIAASIAIFATFPMEELKEKIAPMFTTLGLVETLVLVLIKSPLQKTIDTRSQNIFMVECTARHKATYNKQRHF